MGYLEEEKDFSVTLRALEVTREQERENINKQMCKPLVHQTFPAIKQDSPLCTFPDDC